MCCSRIMLSTSGLSMSTQCRTLSTPGHTQMERDMHAARQKERDSSSTRFDSTRLDSSPASRSISDLSDQQSTINAPQREAELKHAHCTAHSTKHTLRGLLHGEPVEEPVEAAALGEDAAVRPVAFDHRSYTRVRTLTAYVLYSGRSP